MSKDLEESSMNFDMENVRPFLQRIAPFIDSGFGAPEIDLVEKMVNATDHDQEGELSFQITHAGAPHRFVVRVFMDDIDAPDLYFFGPKALAERIDDEMDTFCEELGI